jgi:hypothetical protein
MRACPAATACASPERPRHHQLRDRDRRGLLGALAGGGDHARDRQHDASAWAASRRPTSCRSSPGSPSTRRTSTTGAHGRAHRALLRPRDARDGADAAQHPARLLLRRDRCEIPQPMRIERGAGGEPRASTQAADLLAQAKFPVILSGGGVVMGDGVEVHRAGRAPGAPVVQATCTTTASRPATRCGAARSATRAARRR